MPHRVELYDIDLRWGITEDEARNEKVIRLCLEQVDECRPFFLAFLGHRYGWVPERMPDDTGSNSRSCRDFQVSASPSWSSPRGDDRPPGQRSLVLLRGDEAWRRSPRRPATATSSKPIPPCTRSYWRCERSWKRDRCRFSPIRQSGIAKLWDRVVRERGRLDGLDDFGKAVEAWLWNAIQAELNLPDTPATLDPLDAEADLHERFLELRSASTSAAMRFTANCAASL